MSPSRRQAAIGLLAAAVPAAAFAQTAASQAALQPIGAQTEMPDEDQPNTQLDTTEDKSEHMLAPVSINGKGPFNFLLDTGANVSCVSPRLVEQLALTAGPPAIVHTVVGARERPSVVIDDLQVGSRNRRRVTAPALPLVGPEIDGVLGVDWLKGQRLVLDFKTNKLEITQSQRDQSEPGHVAVVPARRRKGQLTIVDADLSGKRISAIIDSGAQATLCNSPLRELVRDDAARKGRVEQTRIVRMETLAGEVFHGESMYLPFLRLGGLHLGNVQVTYADAHVFDVWGLKTSPALVIGMDLLKQFEVVALDFGRSAVRFEFV
jgi:predicted aspartyl protease